MKNVFAFILIVPVQAPAPLPLRKGAIYRHESGLIVRLVSFNDETEIAIVRHHDNKPGFVHFSELSRANQAEIDGYLSR